MAAQYHRFFVVMIMVAQLAYPCFSTTSPDSPPSSTSEAIIIDDSQSDSIDGSKQEKTCMYALLLRPMFFVEALQSWHASRHLPFYSLLAPLLRPCYLYTLAGNLYMAPSSLVGHAGMGVYSVHEYQIGDLMLTGGPDGPSIAVVDADASGEGDSVWLDFVRTHWINSFGQYW
jgi:hypothetical protein